MNDEGLADVTPLTPFVYPDFTQESVRDFVDRSVLPTPVTASVAERELRVSHLLPAALYEFARDPTRTNPNPARVTS
jgi:hypothetical protein